MPNGRSPSVFREAISHRQIAFFSVPARGDAGLQDDLNGFLRSQRVLTVHREFVGQGENAFWALAVECLDGPCCPGAPGQREAARSGWTACLGSCLNI
jgi:hypothetical protein